jgi:hypothetical protein
MNKKRTLHISRERRHALIKAAIVVFLVVAGYYVTFVLLRRTATEPTIKLTDPISLEQSSTETKSTNQSLDKSPDSNAVDSESTTKPAGQNQN